MHQPKSIHHLRSQTWLVVFGAIWALTLSQPTLAIELELVDDYRWDEVAPDDPERAARFGHSIATDGEWAVISANLADDRDGRLVLFQVADSGRPWRLIKPLTLPSGRRNCFQVGERLFIEGDWLVSVNGTTGTAESCRPFIYGRNEGGMGNWGLVGILPEPGDITDFVRAGAWSDVSISGEFMAIGRSGTAFIGDTQVNSLGEVAIHQRDAGGANNWGEIAMITAPRDQWVNQANFGLRVALEGDLLLVGSARYSDDSFGSTGRAWLFERNLGGANNWGLRKTFPGPRPGDNAGFGDDLDIEADMIAIAGAAGDLTPNTSNDRAVYMFLRNEGGSNNWGLVDEVLPNPLNSGFGGLIQMTGNLMLVGDGSGVFNSNGAWLYQRAGNLWPLRQSFLQADTNEPEPELFRSLGQSAGLGVRGTRTVAIVGDVGFELVNAGARIGKAFFFEFDDGLFSDSFE